MEYKVKKRNGEEITIEIKDYLTYFERNEIMDKASKFIQGNVELKVGALLSETLKKAIVKVPEGVDWEKDIDPASLDEIFQYYSADFGLISKKKA